MKNIDIEKIELLHDFIVESARIVTVSHTHPDGDALGSSLAMNGWLSSLGKDVVSLFPDSVSDNIGFVPEGERILIHSENPEAVADAVAAADLIVCLDFNSFSRTEAMAGILAGAECRKVLVDHHIGPDCDSFDVCISETEVSSASELLYHVLMLMPEVGGDASRLPASSARALMIGMTTDTNNFSNSTYPSTLQMASELLAAGVDREEILSHILQEYRENRLRLLGHLLKDVMTITEDNVAYMVLDAGMLEKYDVREGDTEGLVNMPLTIGRVRMSIMLKQDNGHFRVSIRSKKGTSANRCAKLYFNGGGHEQAAGGKLFFPGDIADSRDAAAYIETKTSEFFKG